MFLLKSPSFVQHPSSTQHTQPSRLSLAFAHLSLLISQLSSRDGPRQSILWLDGEDIPHRKDGAAEQGSSKEQLKPG